MKAQNILAIDQGTTSSRAIIFSPEGEILATAQKELKLSYPKKSWVEQNPEDIWQDVLWCCQMVLNKIDPLTVAGIGITNQRETTVIWDRKTGKPIYNAIVWQDRRTADICATLKSRGHENIIQEKTGLLLDPYFSASKISWILNNVEGAKDAARRGDLAFGTIDCFLLWRLTSGKIHCTDATNAARTMLYDIRAQKWDEALLSLFDIPSAILPEVKDNIDDFGNTSPGLLCRSYPIGGMAGDQQAALIGQACFKPGMVKSTYGTGCFLLMNAGEDFKISQNNLLTTIAYRLNGKTTYAAEGSIFIAGAAIQWLRDNLGIIKDAAQSQTMAESVLDNNGVYFVPAFAGLGAPYWQPDARGIISGLTRDSTAAHICRAALEAQAYQTLDLINEMIMNTGQKPALIRIDGGLVSNSFACQFLADMLNIPLEIPHESEATAWGAAYLAGVSAGIFENPDRSLPQFKIRKTYHPKMEDKTRLNLYAGWKEALGLVLRHQN